MRVIAEKGASPTTGWMWKEDLNSSEVRCLYWYESRPQRSRQLEPALIESRRVYLKLKEVDLKNYFIMQIKGNLWPEEKD